MTWLKEHEWITFFISISGLSLFGVVTWLIQRIRKLNELIRTHQNLSELCSRVIKTEEKLLSSFTELSDRFVKLTNATIQFPDSSKFLLLHGVYWYIGTDGAHAKDSPICSSCLVEHLKPYPLVLNHRGVWTCQKCKNTHFVLAIKDHIESLQNS